MDISINLQSSSYFQYFINIIFQSHMKSKLNPTLPYITDFDGLVTKPQKALIIEPTSNVQVDAL